MLERTGILITEDMSRWLPFSSLSRTVIIINIMMVVSVANLIIVKFIIISFDDDDDLQNSERAVGRAAQVYESGQFDVDYHNFDGFDEYDN